MGSPGPRSYMILPLQTEGHPNSLLHGDLPNKWYRAVSRTSDNASGRRFRKLRRRVHVVQEVAHELVDASPHAGSEGGLEVASAAQMCTIFEPVPLEVVHFFVHAVGLVARINHPGHQIGTRPEERGQRRYATPEANELRGHHVELRGIRQKRVAVRESLP